MTPKPKTAREKYIGKIANDESLRIDDIPAKTPTEKYLKEIASRSGGSGIFWVEVSGTNNGGNDNTFEKASHTAAEITDAYNRFEFPILRVSMATPGGETVVSVATFAGARDVQGQSVVVFAAGTDLVIIDYRGEVIANNS